ncbi:MULTISPECIES: protein-export chaperone SecB [Marichromatium]|uniref:Protein-export protein SecB n=1 Tax=Marichromatium gracile TaxID=1048 RepID=A0A4R4AKF3_MARGR|nr:MULTISPECIES: protein-export chaperone SecB [Marichromatium]MBO8085187.1 protein-export chaperone SecB [Marichromatium sp.]MBK1707547.1 protein-export chaperone SecB [Marichromatium gracile]RNE91982.1 protein-export chaperone SecB [Marichromatium sp. AB31]RNE92935.1 protein-export chaperone SecB [Marichromatium sp. AB32]TCW39897.1 protein translocase subunit secB [Marichromatium gracile]
MADKQQQTPERQFSVQRVYIKDVSFESPNAPELFRGDWTPKHTLNLNTRINDLDKDHYEVVLEVTVTVKVGDKTAFIVEVQQAGIFNIAGFPEQELGPMLGAYCPSLLFPYAREVVSDLVVKGSFPQLVLQHVNFDMLFAQHQQQRAQQEAQQGGTEPAEAVQH